MLQSLSEDTILQRKLQAKLKSEKLTSKPLRNIRDCCHHSAPLGVVITKTNGMAVAHGVIHCHSNACPVCASYKMLEYKNLLEDAFVAFRQKNLKATMITLTVPHWLAENTDKNPNLKLGQQIPLKTTLTVLQQCLAALHRSGTWRKIKSNLNIKYGFQVMETTFSTKTGWHPHYHIIYWTDADKFNQLNELEPTLDKLWRKYVKKYVNQIFHRTKFDNSYAELGGFYFSKDNKGKVREVNCNNYFWSATQEMTGLRFKKTHSEYSRTIWQLLNDAILKDDNRAWGLWKEYADSLYNTQPYRFSTGTKKAILAWREQNPSKTAKEIRKKKSQTQRTQMFICYFPCEEWNYASLVSNQSFRDQIFDCVNNTQNLIKIQLAIKKICDNFKIKVFFNKPSQVQGYIDTILAA